MKRALSLLLVLLFICSLAPMALAAGTDSGDAKAAADTLYKFGLFKGTGTDENGDPIYDLDRAPTRHEAVTMLVRLLGQENYALTSNWTTPFTDVADWAAPYVGSAYANKLTNGISADAYGGENTVTASQYITFVLRALGYESGTDFQWDSAWTLSDEIGLTDGSYNADSGEFTRGDVAIVSCNALNMKLKGSDSTLFEVLNKDGFGKMEGAFKAYDLKFVKIGGRLYENAELSVEQFGGGEYYVQAKDLFTLFVILTGEYTVNGSYASSSYMAGKIDKYANAKNESFGGGEDWGIIWTLGDFVYKLNYRQAGEYVDSWMSFTIGDKSCTVPSQNNSGGYNEQVMYCCDGIRCYNEMNGTYVNLNEILQAMGYNKTIGISNELGGAEAVWYFTDLEAVTQ